MIKKLLFVITSLTIVFLSLPKHNCFSSETPYIGSFDSSFNGSGNLVYGGILNDTGNALAVQPDGKIIAVGTLSSGQWQTNIIITRLNPDGSVDTTFGTSGSGTRILGGAGADAGNAVAVQSDGKIVVVGVYDKGSGDTDIYVKRLNSDGSNDTSFGPTGTGGALFGGSGTDKGNGLAIQSDGKILVIGTYTYDAASGDTDIIITRFNSNGTVDTTFGTSGSGTRILGDAGADAGNAVAVQSDGKIVVVGAYDKGSGDTDLYLARLNSDGSSDIYFGPVIFGGSGADSGNALTIQADGKITVIGTYTYNAANGDTNAIVTRFNSDGTVDTSFGTLGYVIFGGPGADRGSGVAVQSDGKIVITGTTDKGVGDTDSFVQRLNIDGSYDTSFGPLGTGGVFFGGSGADNGKGIAVQPDGQIVIAGAYANSSTLSDIWITRLIASFIIPTASFSATPSIGTSPLTVNFTDQSTGSIASHQWDFGDGSVSTAQNPSHLYQNPGTYTVTLTVTGTAGSSSRKDTIVATSSTTGKPQMTVIISGAGSGTVAATGLSCSGGICNGNYDSGTSLQLSATPDVNSTFMGWSGGGCSGTGPCDMTIYEDTKVTATFAPKSYTITSTAGLGGSISPSGPVSLNHGANQSFTVTPIGNYHVADIFVDGVSVGPLTNYQFTNISAGHTISATFAMDTLTVTSSVSGGNGTITCPSPANYNTSVNCIITPETGYHLAALMDNGSNRLSSVSGNIYTISNVTSDHTVTATFIINSYTVTPSIATGNGKGTVSPNIAQTVNYNGTTSFTVTPAAGYRIASVTGCAGMLTGSTYTTGAITADCEVNVTFEATLIGNVDSEGPSSNRVDGFDLMTLSVAFGSGPGDSNWNPACDLDKTGASGNKVDGSDLIVLGAHFGEVGQW